MIHVALFGSRHQRNIQAVETLIGALLSHGRSISLSIEARFHSYLKPLLTIPDEVDVFSSISTPPDIALSLGGDGTFLRVAKMLCRHDTPIMGVNTGHLGYLSCADIEHPDSLVADILARNYRVEPRALLKVTYSGMISNHPFYALNEVAVLRRDTASMITIDATLDDEPLAAYRGDGLIISTPTGSTGYNLSVGGPIVAPETPCWIISPIATHSLNMRPLVVPNDAEIRLAAQARSESMLLSLDGKATVLPIDTRIHIARATFDTLVVHRGDQSFVKTIRTKLLWGASQQQE